jgi:hypothetical protein
MSTLYASLYRRTGDDLKLVAPAQRVSPKIEDGQLVYAPYFGEWQIKSGWHNLVLSLSKTRGGSPAKLFELGNVRLTKHWSNLTVRQPIDLIL